MTFEDFKNDVQEYIFNDREEDIFGKYIINFIFLRDKRIYENKEYSVNDLKKVFDDPLFSGGIKSLVIKGYITKPTNMGKFFVLPKYKDILYFKFDNNSENIQLDVVDSSNDNSIQKDFYLINDNTYEDLLSDLSNFWKKFQNEDEKIFFKSIIKRIDAWIHHTIISQEIKVIALMLAVFEKVDRYTVFHQLNVAHLTNLITRKLDNTSNEKIYLYSLSALLHDIGKFQIPLNILIKPGKLNDYDKKYMAAHVDLGRDVIKVFEETLIAKNILSRVGNIIYQHHARIDSISSNPAGIKYSYKAGIKIDEGAKIIAVADTVESSMNHRPYQIAKDQEFIWNEIRNPSEFDRGIAEICINIFKDNYKFPFNPLDRKLNITGKDINDFVDLLLNKKID